MKICNNLFSFLMVFSVFIVINTSYVNAQTINSSISFSKSEVTVNVGQVEKVTVYGSGNGSFYISSYGSDSVYASIEGNIITMTGSKVGGSNISVCQFGGTCANLYGFVPNSNANAQSAQIVPVVIPILSAFYISSNNVGGGFLGKGSALTIKFNTSADITSSVLKVNGQIVPTTGNGSGPYGGTYTVAGNEQNPLPIMIDFTTSQGALGHESFTVGENKSVVSSPVAVPLSATVIDANPRQNESVKFTRYLQGGSKGTDVTTLQTLLKKLGVYNGPITGYFGILTEAGVKKYQAKNKLDQVGVVGPATRKLLNQEK